jgi:hypothetical protein
MMLCNAICVQRCKGAKAKALASPRLMARTLDRAKGQGAGAQAKGNGKGESKSRGKGKGEGDGMQFIMLYIMRI